ncbi:MAG: 1-deoxy-D-xylulose-5-phosphate reductoisomerase [Bacteroidales bacterium]|nr:1-deoxy-D-xylulose-5-phosphate reductoisomerase [Bacteroidales bacterium]
MGEAKRHIAILGSTGSIGTQALDVIGQHPEAFQVELLTANSNSKLLIEQAARFRPNAVVICDESRYDEVQAALDPLDIKVFTGIDSICSLVKGENIDIVLTAMVGFSGLKPTIAAIEASKTIALANKETLVAAGEIVTSLAKRYRAPIVPVDSEHSAIFQCLAGNCSPIEKILLTGSGGPFLNASKDEIYNATKEQALNHPRWKMGAKVTIDSASLMNKGLELIEARWLFNTSQDDIEVVIHPQSIIHSMVQFEDGTVMAQMSIPDMRIPIQYAIGYPLRRLLDTKRIDFAQLASMTFFKPDIERFPCLGYAYAALKEGGNATCIMNAANEVAVAAFLQGKIRFGQIPEVIDHTMSHSSVIRNADLESIYATNDSARKTAEGYVNKL